MKTTRQSVPGSTSVFHEVIRGTAESAARRGAGWPTSVRLSGIGWCTVCNGIPYWQPAAAAFHKPTHAYAGSSRNWLCNRYCRKAIEIYKYCANITPSEFGLWRNNSCNSLWHNRNPNPNLPWNCPPPPQSGNWMTFRLRSLYTQDFSALLFAWKFLTCCRLLRAEKGQNCCF